MSNLGCHMKRNSIKKFDAFITDSDIISQPATFIISLPVRKTILHQLNNILFNSPVVTINKLEVLCFSKRYNRDSLGR
jgi:hypothetical protein